MVLAMGPMGKVPFRNLPVSGKKLRFADAQARLIRAARGRDRVRMEHVRDAASKTGLPLDRLLQHLREQGIFPKP
jgi:hypothetical protein